MTFNGYHRHESETSRGPERKRGNKVVRDFQGPGTKEGQKGGPRLPGTRNERGATRWSETSKDPERKRGNNGVHDEKKPQVLPRDGTNRKSTTLPFTSLSYEERKFRVGSSRCVVKNIGYPSCRRWGESSLVPCT